MSGQVMTFVESQPSFLLTRWQFLYYFDYDYFDYIHSLRDDVESPISRTLHPISCTRISLSLLDGTMRAVIPRTCFGQVMVSRECPRAVIALHTCRVGSHSGGTYVCSC